jgi:single-stranded-DNA-specific exonuclease
MSLEEASSRIAEHLSRHEFVEVYAHHDADGIAAGAILCTALLRNNTRFRLRVVHRISPAELSPDVPTLLCDLGSGLEDLQKEVMVIDHHLPRFTGELHVNPRLEGIDADRELSSAGAAYLVAQQIGDNRDLAGLVMLGILGDDQDLAGPNLEIFNEAVAQALVTPDRGCLLPGRDLHERLLCAMHPYLHLISGDEMAVADLIDSAVSEGEMQYDELLSLIVLRVSPFSPAATLTSLFGDRFILEREVVPDAHTLTAIVDACGKCGRGGLAASLCLRSSEGLSEAWETAQGHRLHVIQELRTAVEKQNSEGFYEVEEISVTSDVADALARDTIQEVPVVVSARHGDLCHISVRSPPEFDANIGEETRNAALECGGFGGGHRRRAGATINCARIDEFRAALARGLAV